MKSVLKYIRNFTDEHAELARAGKVLLIFAFFTLLAFFLGEFNPNNPLDFIRNKNQSTKGHEETRNCFGILLAMMALQLYSCPSCGFVENLFITNNVY